MFKMRTGTAIALMGLAVLALQGCRVKKDMPAAGTPPAVKAEQAAPKADTPAPKIEQAQQTDDKDKQGALNMPKGLYATLETSKGKIVCRLFEEQTPITVQNFTELAEGKREWVDPATGQRVKRPFYDGLIFHRVIPNFMIQGGCPLGTGTGGPGYRFNDEIVSSLKFDHPGLLAMANAGPGTNGSQFFITTAATSWLNGHHTIFGEVVEGYKVVEEIGNSPRGPNDKPQTPIVIKKVKIERVK
jgi:peptidyl-prolyl cis-trans isomerase A (cyclophilin A)